MFDLDISKMALIGVVALVVLGPERLPRVARTAGALLGRAQRYINDVKSEVTREIEIEELRKMKSGFEEAAASVHSTIHDTVREHTADLTNAWNNGAVVSERIGAADSSAIMSAPPKTAKAAASDWLAPKTHFGSTRRRNWRVRRSALPIWYKQANLKRTHLVSTAAREAQAARLAAGATQSAAAPAAIVANTSLASQAVSAPARRRIGRFL